MSGGGAYAIDGSEAGSAPLATLMASPQREHGHLDVANELAEAFARAKLGGSQWQVMWVVLRRTYGWNRTMETISVRQIVEATQLHRKTVEEAVRALVAGQYLRAEGDDHHPKRLGIQKDYERWGQAVAPKCEPIGAQTVSQTAHTPGESVSRSAPKCEPDDSQRVSQSAHPIYKEGLIPGKPQKTSTAPDGAGAADAPPPGTLREQFEWDYKAAGNRRDRIGVAGTYFGRMLGPPDYGRIGRLLDLAKSGRTLFNAMVEAAAQTITDDPHDYVQAILKRELGKERGHDDGRRSGGGAGTGEARPGRGGPAARPGAAGGHRTYRDSDLWSADFRPKE